MKSTATIVLVASALSASAPSALRRDKVLYLTEVASKLVEEGLAATAPTGQEAAAFEEVPAPGIQFRPSQAQATLAPWINSNGWRFQRGLTKANYASLPAGSAPLAAAEAFAFNVDAILNPDTADVEDLGRMLRLLKTQEAPPLPAIANVAVVDDRSPQMGEVLNMLTRRNLLYRVVAAPDSRLPTVQLGTPDFPRETAQNPSDFAARVREKIGDDNRLVRVYGTNTVIAHLTGDRTRARLFLLVYGNAQRRQGRSQQDVRIRLLGRYQPIALAAYGSPPDAKLIDVEHPGNTTEFSLPPFTTCAIVNLSALK
jgi:hypothetical protein